MLCHSVRTHSIVSRSTVEVGLALIIRFALETFPVISIYHLAKASISERPRLYLLFSYSVEIASLLSLSVSLQNIVVIFAYQVVSTMCRLLADQNARLVER